MKIHNFQIAKHRNNRTQQTFPQSMSKTKLNSLTCILLIYKIRRNQTQAKFVLHNYFGSLQSEYGLQESSPEHKIVIHRHFTQIKGSDLSHTCKIKIGS